MTIRYQRRAALGAVMIILLLALAAWMAARVTPKYEGHTLQYWILALADADDVSKTNHAEAVIKRIGPSVLPELVELIDFSESWISQTVALIRSRVPPRSPMTNRESRMRSGVVSAFRILGTAGENALPRLDTILTSSNTPPEIEKKFAAAQSMAGIGAPSLPYLQKALTAGNKTAKIASLLGLHDLAATAAAVAPQVRLCGGHTDPEVRQYAVMCWSSIVTNVDEKVPFLLEMLHDRHPDVSKCAEHYIIRTGPKAIPLVLRETSPTLGMTLSNKIIAWKRSFEP